MVCATCPSCNRLAPIDIDGNFWPHKCTPQKEDSDAPKAPAAESLTAHLPSRP
jgi:hypothetical protein